MRRNVTLWFLLSSVLFAPLCFATTISVVSHRYVYRNSSAVFVGTVISVTEPRDGRGYAIRFRVDKRWKGPRIPELTVRAPSGAGTYIPRFEVGEKYLVYSSFEQDTPSTPRELHVEEFGGIGRTRRLNQFTPEKVREYKQLNSPWFRLWSHIP
jgi:hypothetical protein